MNESLLTALVDELNKLNENISLHNDILVSHYASLGEIEFIDADIDLDS